MTTPINDLETRIAFQEDLLNSLNLTVFKQQQRIDQLETQFKQVMDLLRGMQQGDNMDLGGNQPPPTTNTRDTPCETRTAA